MNKQFQCVLYIFIFTVISIHQLVFARNLAENLFIYRNYWGMAAGVVVVTHYNHSWNINELLERLSTSCFNMMDHIDHLSTVMTHTGTPHLWTTIGMIQANFYWLNPFRFTASPLVLLYVFDLYCSSSHAYLWLIPCQELHLDGLLEDPLPVALCSWTDYLQVKEDWFASKD